MKSSRALTLVEVLAVVAIAAIVIAAFSPALSSARLNSRNLTCQCNQRLIGQMFHIFGQDNATFPHGDSMRPGLPWYSWVNAVLPVDSNGFASSIKCLYCPNSPEPGGPPPSVLAGWKSPGTYPPYPYWPLVSGPGWATIDYGYNYIGLGGGLPLPHPTPGLIYGGPAWLTQGPWGPRVFEHLANCAQFGAMNRMSDTILVIDTAINVTLSDPTGVNHTGWHLFDTWGDPMAAGVPVPRHRGSANAAWADGHVTAQASPDGTWRGFYSNKCFGNIPWPTAVPAYPYAFARMPP
jgi:prepilin-type processing-associated H-X9-DG protein